MSTSKATRPNSYIVTAGSPQACCKKAFAGARVWSSVTLLQSEIGVVQQDMALQEDAEIGLAVAVRIA
jgi:hypothetical protein